MLKRHRYFALVSWAVLAYIILVLTSQYVYQDLVGKHSLMFPIRKNSSQVMKQLSTSTLKNVSREKDLGAPDTAAKFFLDPKDGTSKLLNLQQSSQDLLQPGQWAVEKGTKLLMDEMRGYSFPANKSLRDFVVDHGGEPVTTWRSGSTRSTFLGAMLESHPGMYYQYEPLNNFDIVQVRKGKRSKEALRVLRELMNCRYQSLGDYIKYGKEHPWMLCHNTRIWNLCNGTGKVCWDPQWLSAMCSIFPFQAMKTVRMRLHLARQLLQDKKLNVRVLYLVRDPRGTMQSRSHRDDYWCPGNPLRGTSTGDKVCVDASKSPDFLAWLNS